MKISNFIGEATVYDKKQMLERKEPISWLKSVSAFANTNGGTWIFGVLTSSVHMAWMRVVAGRLKPDYRYSAAIVYNNFPWPEIDDVSTDTCPNDGCGARSGGAVARAPAIGVKSQIEETAQAILDARAHLIYAAAKERLAAEGWNGFGCRAAREGTRRTGARTGTRTVAM